ncbi:LacI family DNA-binding transcriptional regulator [Andreprevotia chitinilytica]|uniref:LacI family DNA-binding transcriptional regulator n=1 Tax=Andreprevotia chitinilytica TaxID=396808 RepID=UPI00068BAA83|nr:LacI family DNA-binding transcriptional regulator [Andreprevotia chitinilytica]
MPRKAKQGMPRAATLHDVAAKVGVSAITVSRALNSPDLVSKNLREQILAIVDELGYVPNRSARTLVSSRSYTVAVLIPSLSNTVFIDTLAGISEVLDPRGYQILIGNTAYDDEKEERLLRTHLSHKPDGVLLTGIRQRPQTLAHLAKLGIPAVHMMELDPTDACLCVGFSQEAAGRQITEHLLARGYRRIAFFGARLDPRVMQRLDGYRKALQAAGCHAAELEYLNPRPSKIGLGVEMLDTLRREHPDCDAVFCCNDDLALGVLTGCQRTGIAVPAQLAVAGFNDLEGAAWATPALTSVRTPRYRVGFEAATLLLQLMEGEATPALRQLDLGFELQLRGSS